MLASFSFKRKMFLQKSVAYKSTTPKNWERFKTELKVVPNAMRYIFLNKRAHLNSMAFLRDMITPRRTATSMVRLSFVFYSLSLSLSLSLFLSPIHRAGRAGV